MGIKYVGVIRGGTDDIYESSLMEGGELIVFLSEQLADKYKPVDILIDRSGTWHMAGVPVEPASLMRRIDLAWNTANPSFAWMLKDLSIPTVSAPAHLHTLKASREMLLEHMKKLDVHLPRRVVIGAYYEHFDGDLQKFAFRKAKSVHEKFGAPWLVKSFPPDRHKGVRVLKTFEELLDTIYASAAAGVGLEVEELISEKSTEVHVVPGFRGEDLYTLPVQGFSELEKDKILALAKNMYQHFGADSYFNARLLLHPRRGIFLHEVRLLPDLHPSSHLHQAVELIGAKTRDIIDSLLERAR